MIFVILCGTFMLIIAWKIKKIKRESKAKLNTDKPEEPKEPDKHDS